MNLSGPIKVTAMPFLIDRRIDNAPSGAALSFMSAFLFALALLCPAAPTGAVVCPTYPSVLFSRDVAQVSSTATFPKARRSRWASLDPSVFSTLASSLGHGSVAPSIVLNLFHDVPCTLVVERPFFGTDGTLSGWGHLAGLPGSWAVFSYGEKALYGELRVPGKGDYELRSVGDGVVRITEKDGTDQELGIEPTPLPVPQYSQQQVGHPIYTPLNFPADCPYGAQNANIVDVMILYTTAGINAAGSLQVLRRMMDTALNYANMCHYNGRTNTELHLVYSGWVDYTSVDLSTDLGRLVNTTDGYLDGVPALRDQYGADLVSLWPVWGGGIAYYAVTSGPVGSPGLETMGSGLHSTLYDYLFRL